MDTIPSTSRERRGRLWAIVPAGGEGRRCLDSMHAAMPAQDFSVNLLQSAATQFAVMETRDLIWSDWNHPVCMERSLQRLGECPIWTENGVTRPRAR